MNSKSKKTGGNVAALNTSFKLETEYQLSKLNANLEELNDHIKKEQKQQKKFKKQFSDASVYSGPVAGRPCGCHQEEQNGTSTMGFIVDTLLWTSLAALCIYGYIAIKSRNRLDIKDSPGTAYAD